MNIGLKMAADDGLCQGADGYHASVSVVSGLVFFWRVEPNGSCCVQVDAAHDDEFAGAYAGEQLQADHVAEGNLRPYASHPLSLHRG